MHFLILLGIKKNGKGKKKALVWGTEGDKVLEKIIDWWWILTRTERITISLFILGSIGGLIKLLWPKKKKDGGGLSETVVGDSQKIEKVQAKTVTTMQDSVIGRSQRNSGGVYIEKVEKGATVVINVPPAIDYQDGVGESEVPKVRELFEVGREHIAKGEYREAIGVFEACLGFEKDHEKLGAIYIQTGNCYYGLRRYNEAGRFYADGLKEAEKADDGEGEASALGNIALTFHLRTAADGATRGNNVKKAVQYYKNALQFFTRDEYPVDYAIIQNNLGNAYTDLPSATLEERDENVRRAIVCYEAALEIYKKDEYPVDYAMTKINLGAAYTDLPSTALEERYENVRRAIVCYEVSLEIYKKDEYPYQYAMTQNNLGNAYTDLPSATGVERAEKVRKSIECYEAALEIYKEDEYPVQYAMTQNNLGNAYYTDLSVVNPHEFAERLDKVVACYVAALEIYKKDEYPVQYAATQNNLGNALRDMPVATDEEREDNVRKAIACCEAALEIYKKDEYPVDYATTQNSLGGALVNLPAATPQERAENVKKAIACWKAALEIRKKDEYPQDYCMTAANMGMILIDIDKSKACYWLKEAYSLRQFLSDQGKSTKELIEKVCE